MRRFCLRCCGEWGEALGVAPATLPTLPGVEGEAEGDTYRLLEEAEEDGNAMKKEAVENFCYWWWGGGGGEK